MPKPKNTSFLNPPDPSLWAGRKSPLDKGIQYWYQAISFDDLGTFESTPLPDIGLLGYACDAGIQRNQGRVGAKAGPSALRKRLGKLAFHHSSRQLMDFGDIICLDDALEECQQAFTKQIKYLLSKGIFPIAFGGGHDIAYAHFKGIWEMIGATAKNKVGVINFDAHFDLRPTQPQSNSGTPFYQILHEFPDHSSYFVLGIQPASNPPSLYEIAKKLGVTFLEVTACDLHYFETVKQSLDLFIAKNDYLYISIDMDGFSSAIAPGVSAPSPMGLSVNFILKTLEYLFQSKKVIACDIAELNPRFDRDQATANLAAQLVDFIVGLQTSSS